MEHDTALELISALLDGEISPEEEAQLQAHLGQCARCQALYDQLSALHRACGQLEVSPPPELASRVLEHLPPQPRGKVVYWRRWGAMAAAIALVALAAWRLPGTPWRSGGVSHDSAPAPAAAPAEMEIAVADETAEAGLAEIVMGDDTGAEAVPADVPVAAAGGVGNGKMDYVTQKARGVAREGEDQVVLFAADTASPDTSPVQADPDRNGGALSSTADGAWADAAALPEPSQYSIAGHAQAEKEDWGVPETPPDLMGEADTQAQVFEETVEDLREFSSYRAVITLSSPDFDGGDYPRQRQENGEMWYLLPASALDTLPRDQAEAGFPCQVRSQGEDLSSQSPWVLVVLPAE